MEPNSSENGWIVKNDAVNIISLHNIKVGKDTVDNDPEDDQGNTPYQKYQFSPEKKRKR